MSYYHHLIKSAPSMGALTTAWIAATSETNTTIISALNTLETDLTTYGLTAKIKALYPFCGGTASKHKFNFLDARDLDAAFRLTFNGGWTHASTGSTPNGTNAYANTYLIPSTSLSQNNAGMGFYNRTNTSYAGAHGTRVGNNFEIFPRWTDGSFYCYINDSGAGFGGAIAGSSGFIQGSRTGSNSIRLNRNTTQYTGTQASTGIPYGSFWIGASNNNATGIYFDNRELALFYISEGFNNTEMQNFYTAVQAFQTTLSRQIVSYPSSLKLFIDAGNASSYPGTGTTVTDLIGTQNGTLTNGVGYSSADGGYFTFDGVNDYIDFGINNAIRTTSARTISLWININSGYGNFFSDTNVTGYQGAELWFDTGYFRTVVCGAATYQVAPLYNNFSYGVWRYVTLSWNGTTLKAYWNGVLNTSIPQTVIPVNNTTASTKLGLSNELGGRLPLNGKISQCKIYNVQLSDAEVLTDFNEFKSRYGY